MPEAPDLAAALLAAGRSRRLGGNKQLLPLGGETLVARAARGALAGPAAAVVVVLGAAAEAVRAQLPRDSRLHPVFNPRYARGQGGSLRTAARALAPLLPGAALAVLLVDTPFVGPWHVEAVWAALRRQGGAYAAARAVHGPSGRPGHPVVFAPAAVADLRGLPDGDAAPRAYLRELGGVLEVPFGEDDVIFDVDTRRDYGQALRRAPR